jgi:hypothetical protein
VGLEDLGEAEIAELDAVVVAEENCSCEYTWLTRRVDEIDSLFSGFRSLWRIIGLWRSRTGFALAPRPITLRPAAGGSSPKWQR